VKLVHLVSFITKKLHPLLKANTFKMVFFVEANVDDTAGTDR